jgi:hypothetical protein
MIEAKSTRYIFDSIKMQVDSQTKSFPTLQAIAVYICGHIGIKKEDNSPNTWAIAGYNASVGRRVFSKQLPNPIAGETWETEGIMERLVP